MNPRLKGPQPGGVCLLHYPIIEGRRARVSIQTSKQFMLIIVKDLPRKVSVDPFARHRLGTAHLLPTAR